METLSSLTFFRIRVKTKLLKCHKYSHFVLAFSSASSLLTDPSTKHDCSPIAKYFLNLPTSMLVIFSPLTRDTNPTHSYNVTFIIKPKIF